jgi:hypothetical protein
MGLGVSSIFKLAKGGLSPDELAEILEAAGIQADFKTVAPSREAFDPLAQAMACPGSKVIQLHCRMKDGGTVTALLALNQSGN